MNMKYLMQIFLVLFAVLAMGQAYHGYGRHSRRHKRDRSGADHTQQGFVGDLLKAYSQIAG